MPRPFSTDKPEVSETEDGNGHVRDHHDAAPLSRQEMKKQVDAAATAEGLTRESFSHLDEKKILRKACFITPIGTLHRLPLIQDTTDGPSFNPHARPPLPPVLPRP